MSNRLPNIREFVTEELERRGSMWIVRVVLYPLWVLLATGILSGIIIIEAVLGAYIIEEDMVGSLDHRRDKFTDLTVEQVIAIYPRAYRGIVLTRVKESK